MCDILRILCFHSCTQATLGSAVARSARSGTTAAAALTQISGLQSVELSTVPPHDVLDAILALPLPEFQAKLEVATSDELRSLRAYIGLGKAGTKEANKILIYEQVENHRKA